MMRCRSVMTWVVSVVLVAACGEAAAADADDGFVSLFNGKNLTGWDGDMRFWSVAGGAIRGQTTAENAADHNTFLVWRGGKVRDFELRLRFRIEGENNSGVQYRSSEFAKWRIRGYQAEIVNKSHVGFLYNEQLKRKGVQVGQFALYTPEGEKQVLGKVCDARAQWASGHYKQGDWNEMTIVARGDHIIHLVNGRLTVEFIDRDRAKAAREGLLALQVHGGKPLLVEFKDIRLRSLKRSFGPARVLFDGKSLDGWKVVAREGEGRWSVEDGAIVTEGKPFGYARTTETFHDYLLRVQLKHFVKCNTGVLVRVQQPDRVWPKSMEAQGWYGTVGDIFGIGWKFDADASRRYKDRVLDPGGRHVKKMHPSNEGPLGSWIRYEILNDGTDLELTVNRLLQNRAWNVEAKPGVIALQAEGGKVAFRNVVLIPIVPPRKGMSAKP